HWVRSPLLSANRSCQTCHNVPETELVARVDWIQTTTKALMERAAEAMTDMLDAILDAKAAGATDAQLAPILALQTRSAWRLDFVACGSSMGFHAPQEAARLLGDSIDCSRRAQAMAIRLNAPNPPPRAPTGPGVFGVTPKGGPGEKK